MHAESEELARYEKANEEWCELHKPQVRVRHVTLTTANGYVCHLHEGIWFDSKWYRVPSAQWNALYSEYAKQVDSAVQSALEPWMRAIGLTAPPPSLTEQPDSQTRTPSRRKAYIDVTEQVLKMPRATGRDADTVNRLSVPRE